MGHRLHYTGTSAAFVIGCSFREIVGWHASTVEDTTMVTTQW